MNFQHANGLRFLHTVEQFIWGWNSVTHNRLIKQNLWLWKTNFIDVQ